VDAFLAGSTGLDVTVGVPAISVLGGFDGGHVGAGGGDIADAEGRHLFLLGVVVAAHPPLFVDVDPRGGP
jgi:hypothetical protein